MGHNLLLRNTLTPGTIQRYCINSANVLTVTKETNKNNNMKLLIMKLWQSCWYDYLLYGGHIESYSTKNHHQHLLFRTASHTPPT